MRIKVKMEHWRGGFVATVTEKNGVWVNPSSYTDTKKDLVARPTVEGAVGVLVCQNPWMFGIHIEGVDSVNERTGIGAPTNEERMLERQNYE